MVGLTGLILFTVAAKCYKYRKRDDQNFSHRDVEEVFIRYLSEPRESELSSDDSDG